MQETITEKYLVENSEKQSQAVEAVTMVKDFWDDLPDDKKKKILSELWNYCKTIKDSETIQKLIELPPIKETLSSEGLTEEDKDTLARKLNIDRQILDGVDNVFSLISKVCKMLPVSLGVIWDALDLISPVDELIGILLAIADTVLPIGDFLAILILILSFIPDKIIIGAIGTVLVGGAEVVVRVLKDILIYKVIPEPKDTEELQTALNVTNEPAELTESFASQFRLYETLWD